MQLLDIKPAIAEKVEIATQFLATEAGAVELWLNTRLEQDITLKQRFSNGWKRTEILRGLFIAIALPILGFVVMAFDWLYQKSVQRDRTAVVRAIRQIRLLQVLTVRRFQRGYKRLVLVIEASRVKAQTLRNRLRDAQTRARLILK